MEVRVHSHSTTMMCFFYRHMWTVTLLRIQPISDDMLTTSKNRVAFVKCERALRTCFSWGVSTPGTRSFWGEYPGWVCPGVSAQGVSIQGAEYPGSGYVQGQGWVLRECNLGWVPGVSKPWDLTGVGIHSPNYWHLMVATKICTIGKWAVCILVEFFLVRYFCSFCIGIFLTFIKHSGQSDILFIKEGNPTFEKFLNYIDLGLLYLPHY